MNFDLHVEKMLKGLSFGKSINDIAKKDKVPVKQIKTQIKKGKKVEREHGGSVKKSKRIAMDHLIEDPKYYTNLSKMEKNKR